MVDKRILARLLRQLPPLRWALRLAVRLFAPRHYVGAVGAVFNEAGQVLLVNHVFRLDYAWGLPGGWVEQGEHPAETVRREIEEELGLQVVVKQLLNYDLQGDHHDPNTPLGLGFVFYCRVVGEMSGLEGVAESEQAYEVLEIKWLDPDQIPYRLVPLQQAAIMLGSAAFGQEQAQSSATVR